MVTAYFLQKLFAQNLHRTLTHHTDTSRGDSAWVEVGPSSCLLSQLTFLLDVSKSRWFVWGWILVWPQASGWIFVLTNAWTILQESESHPYCLLPHLPQQIYQKVHLIYLLHLSWTSLMLFIYTVNTQAPESIIVFFFFTRNNSTASPHPALHAKSLGHFPRSSQSELTQSSQPKEGATVTEKLPDLWMALSLRSAFNQIRPCISSLLSFKTNEQTKKPFLSLRWDYQPKSNLRIKRIGFWLLDLLSDHQVSPAIEQS